MGCPTRRATMAPQKEKLLAFACLFSRNSVAPALPHWRARPIKMMAEPIPPTLTLCHSLPFASRSPSKFLDFQSKVSPHNQADLATQSARLYILFRCVLSHSVHDRLRVASRLMMKSQCRIAAGVRQLIGDKCLPKSDNDSSVSGK